ncbi:MAG: DinB family protein [Anaerolineae bacterium]|jgi:hypothetical protein
MSGGDAQGATDSLRNALNFQFDISWRMLTFHLEDLEDDECLWRPGPRGLGVTCESGIWVADWPDTESYDMGPSSIAWLTWHIIFWWSMVFDHSFGHGTLSREDVRWPGSMAAVRERIERLYDDWKEILTTLPDKELLSCERTRWPFQDRPFYELAAWLNLELMKNAAEIGAGRFLYASRNHTGSAESQPEGSDRLA